MPGPLKSATRRTRAVRFLIALALTVTVLGLLAPSGTAAAEEVGLVINGQEVSADVPPRIERGRTLVPIRVVSEHLGAQVVWDGQTRTVTIDRGRHSVHLGIGNPTANINGTGVSLDVPPNIYQGRTLVPLRFVGEALGSAVAWDADRRLVSVTETRPSLTGLEIHADAREGRIVFQLTGSVEAQVRRVEATPSSLGRIEVDLPGVENRLTVSEFAVGVGGIVRGRVQPLDQEGGGLRVLLEAGEVPSARLTTAANGRDLELRIGYSISGLRYGYTESGQAVLIEANGPLKPNAYSLDDPARIVVDLPGSHISSRLPDSTDVGGLVGRLRIGQLDESTARVVIDLERAAGFSLQTEGPLTVVYPHRRVTRVSWSVEGGSPRIEIQGEIPLGYHTERTDSGLRMLIPYAVPGDLPAEIRPDTALLGPIRIGTTTWREAPAVTIDVSIPHYTGHQVLQTDLDKPIVIQFTSSVLSGRRVVVDAGHGGKDPGSIGYSGSYEKDVVLQIATLLQKLLQDAGAQVLMTRTDDSFVDLYKRAELANQWGADAFVSIHANSYRDASLSGTETYHFPDSSLAKRLAGLIHQEMLAALGRPDRGVRGADFVVLRETKMPAVLVEAAYLSNPQGERLLLDRDVHLQVAQAVMRGLIRFFQ